jgi:hypothetical protein
MKNIEKQLTDLQNQVEHLTNKVSVLLEQSPAGSGILNRTLVRNHKHQPIQEDRNFNRQKGINRFRSLQRNG